MTERDLVARVVLPVLSPRPAASAALSGELSAGELCLGVPCVAVARAPSSVGPRVPRASFEERGAQPSCRSVRGCPVLAGGLWLPWVPRFGGCRDCATRVGVPESPARDRAGRGPDVMTAVMGDARGAPRGPGSEVRGTEAQRGQVGGRGGRTGPGPQTPPVLSSVLELPRPRPCPLQHQGTEQGVAACPSSSLWCRVTQTGRPQDRLTEGLVPTTAHAWPPGCPGSSSLPRGTLSSFPRHLPPQSQAFTCV